MSDNVPILGEDYWSEEQTCKQLDVCTRTLIRYTKEPNGLPVTRVGGKKFFRKEALRQWLLRREVQRNPSRKRSTAAPTQRNQHARPRQRRTSKDHSTAATRAPGLGENAEA